MTETRPRTGIKPRYQQVADTLLGRVNAGHYTDGWLPTQSEIEAEFEVSTVTARHAMQRLVDIGVAERRQGARPRIIQRQLITIHVTLTEDLSRRRRFALGDACCDSWSSDIREAGHTPGQRFESLNVAADARVAGALRVPVDDTVVVRRCWRTIDGQPASVETSYFPRWLVAELPRLAEPHDIPEGTTLWVSENGHPMVWHVDDVVARLLTAEEATFFDAAPGLGALVRSRTSYGADGRVLRLMDSVYRSDMHQLRFEVPGDGNTQGPPA